MFRSLAKETPLTQVVRFRTVLLALHGYVALRPGLLWPISRAVRRALQVDAPASDGALRFWLWLSFDTLLMLVTVGACYLCLLPLVRDLSRFGTAAPSDREPPSRVLALRGWAFLVGEPWWVRFLLTCPTVALGAYMATALATPAEHRAALALGAAATATLLYLPIARQIWHRSR